MNVEYILASKGREARTIKPGASVEEALQRLRAERIESLVVSENGTDLVGIVSIATSSTPSPTAGPTCCA